MGNETVQPDTMPTPCSDLPGITFETIRAEPERVAAEAATRPLRIDRPDGPPVVLVSADAFEAMQRRTLQELRADESADNEDSGS